MSFQSNCWKWFPKWETWQSKDFNTRINFHISPRIVIFSTFATPQIAMGRYSSWLNRFQKPVSFWF
jgi:hypothetical protein